MKRSRVRNGSIEDFYSFGYEEVMSSGPIGLVWRFIHRQLDRDLTSVASRGKVLEIGAGHGQHLAQFPYQYDLYVETDLRGRPNEFSLASPQDLDAYGAIFRIADAEDLSIYPDNSFDCVIVTCVLAHLRHPEDALREWRRVTKRGGILTIYIPTEPGLLLRFVRYFTTRRKIRHLGFDHGAIHWKEHRNHYLLLNVLIHESFSEDKVKEKLYPLKFLPWDLSLWKIYSIARQT